ncbi:hypothetical protein GXW82_08760 [Streptacidiphilus sp. 4-A2]|nr:hypothetical protein [Streptacidiphilus sp. 4-A2]
MIISSEWHPQDRESELAVIPLDQVWEVHMPLGNWSELVEKGLDKIRADEQWAFRTLEEMYKDPGFRPSAIVFEVEASGTVATAEPGRTKEMLDWARGLMTANVPAGKLA